MAHDDEELDWGEDDGWAADQTTGTMDVDRPADSVPTNGDVSESQPALNMDDQPDVSEKVGESQEPRAETSFSPSTTRNGGLQHRETRRTVSRSSSDFGKSLPPGLPQRPAGSAPHVERSDPLAASAMAPSPSKTTGGLPPDWEERKSRSNGAIYYFNIKTEETTWTKPTPVNGVASTEPARPDSPAASRRDRERRRPTSPNVSSTLPPAPFSLPARPQFNSSQQRRDRSTSPPPRARSRERQKEPERDSRGGRVDRRPAGPQARVSPPPRMRDVHMRDPSPEPTRRYRSPSPQVSRDREKAGGNRAYNDRERSPPPIPRGQRPSSPPPRRDDRGPRRPEDRYPPPRNRSRSPGAPRRRSPSPPTTRRPRSPPRARDLRRPSPPPSSSLPQKRRGDTPPLLARPNVYPDRIDSQRDREGQEDSQTKRRRIDDDRDIYESHVDRRDDRFGPRVGEEGRRNLEDTLLSKRAPLPPQDQRFRTATAKPPRRHRTPSPPPLPTSVTEGRLPPATTSNSGRRDGFTNERHHEGQGTRKRDSDKIKLPEPTAAVVAAYSNRRKKDEVSNTVISDGASSRDGPTSKLPPSGPGGRVQRTYGPALREGAPRPKSPETGREPPRGPRGVQRSPNIVLRPLSPRRDQSPPRQRSPPRREPSPPRRDLSPPRRPRSPILSQQSYPSLRSHDRDAPVMDYEFSSRSADIQMGRRESNRNQERGERSQFDGVEQRGASITQSLANQAPDGPVSRRERGRGRNRKPSPPPILTKTWGQPQNKRSPQSPRRNKVYGRDEDRNRHDDETGRNRAPNDDVAYHEPRNGDQVPEGYSQGSEIRRAQDHPHSLPARYPPPRQPPSEELHPLERDSRSSGRYLRPHESSSQFRDEMDLDEDRAWTNSARFIRDDGQSTRSGVSLEEDYSQRPDPLPEARRLSIWERDEERVRNGISQDADRRDNFGAAPYSVKEENGVSGNRAARGEPFSLHNPAEELPPQARRARSPSSGSSSHRNMRHQPSPGSRTMLEGSFSHKDTTVSSSPSEDFRTTRQTQPGGPPSYEQIANEDRANGYDEQSRRDTIIGRPRIVRRDLSPLSTNGLSGSREPPSTQPTPISADSVKDYAEERGDPSAVGQGPSGKGSLLARLSAPGASSSGDRSKGKRDLPGPSPAGGPSASLQARMENGERPTASRRDTDDGERRRRKSRRGRGGLGGGRNRDVQG